MSATGELGPVAALYSSRMARARQTAEILAPALGAAEVTDDCDFCESHPGEMDGLTWSDADRLYPLVDFDPHRRRAPGAETWAEMAARTAAGLDRLVARHPAQTVVVACHGGVIVHSLIRWFGLTPTAAPGRRARVEPANASITEWSLSAGTGAPGATPVQLVRFNDHGHLRDVAGGSG